MEIKPVSSPVPSAIPGGVPPPRLGRDTASRGAGLAGSVRKLFASPMAATLAAGLASPRQEGAIHEAWLRLLVPGLAVLPVLPFHGPQGEVEVKKALAKLGPRAQQTSALAQHIVVEISRYRPQVLTGTRVAELLGDLGVDSSAKAVARHIEGLFAGPDKGSYSLAHYKQDLSELELDVDVLRADPALQAALGTLQGRGREWRNGLEQVLMQAQLARLPADVTAMRYAAVLRLAEVPTPSPKAIVKGMMDVPPSLPGPRQSPNGLGTSAAEELLTSEPATKVQLQAVLAADAAPTARLAALAELSLPEVFLLKGELGKLSRSSANTEAIAAARRVIGDLSPNQAKSVAAALDGAKQGQPYTTSRKIAHLVQMLQDYQELMAKEK